MLTLECRDFTANYARFARDWIDDKAKYVRDAVDQARRNGLTRNIRDEQMTFKTLKEMKAAAKDFKFEGSMY